MADDRLKILTECGICLKEFTDPRILSCFHTFCLLCFKQMGEAVSKKPGETMPCPLCRKEFTIPAEGMDGLQKNFFMQHLLEVTASLQANDTPAIDCDICKDLYEGQEKSKAATMRCFECRDNFCDICAKAHTLQKLSKGHHIVKIGIEDEEDMRRMFPTRNCAVHNEKSLDYYCSQCKKIVCVSCFVENHPMHECKDVNSVEEEFRQIIEANASKMAIYADEVLPKSKSVDQKKETILLQLAAIETEIEQRHLELKEMIDKHRATLLDELSLIKQKVVRPKDCENEKEEIERRHIILKSFETYCTELRSKGSASDVCGCVDDLMTRANELKRDHEEFVGRPLQITDVSFSPTDLEKIGDTSSMNIVGRIQETFTQMESCVVIAGLHDGRNLLKDVFKINLHRRQEISVQKQNVTPIKLKNGLSAAVNCNTMYVTGVGDNNDEIWKYNFASGWSKCACLVQGRSAHCSEFIDGTLYICGGLSSSKERILKSVEAYNVNTNECAIVGKLNNFVHSSGNCVPFKRSLYIFGGSDRKCNSLNQVQVYDTEKNTCTLLTTPMPRSNRLMQAVLWETSVILLGCDTCFIFNFETKTWEERKQFNTDVVHFGLVLENERMFVIGGGIGIVDDAGNSSWKCRGDVRYVSLKSIINDKPAEWKSYTKLAKRVRVHCYGKMLFLLQSKTI